MRVRSDKALKEPFVKTSSQESVPEFAGNDKLEQETKKFLGPAPILCDESHKDYDEKAYP